MALIDPPYEFDACKVTFCNVRASHFEQLALPTLTERTIAVIAATVLLLLNI
jgi:hypothetical protein